MKLFHFILFSVILGIQSTNKCEAQSANDTDKLVVSLEKRIPSDSDSGAFAIVNEIQRWSFKETAIIICDMWDRHWCQGASERVEEMAPFMNKVVNAARNKGILIVHAPSQCIDFYKNHPARKMGQKYKSKRAKNLISNNLLVSEKGTVWPVDQTDGGCDDDPQCKQGQPWTKQTGLLEISDRDAISDSGIEITGLFEAKGIKNLMLKEKVGSLSRGKRHIHFSNETMLANFIEQNPDLTVGTKNNSIFLRHDEAFTDWNVRVVTHGGSHLWEVLIPLGELS